MKRLIRKIADNDEIEQNNDNTIEKVRQEVMEQYKNVNPTNMIELNQLDEADVRHEKCPKCKHHPLVNKDGFKVCPNCGMVYKMLDGTGYICLG